MTTLAEWNNYYVIIGSCAGALIGLQFVAISIAATRPTPIHGHEVSSAFLTPSVIHFSCTLLLSALATAPWHSLDTVSIIWTLLGAAGFIYVAAIGWMMQKQADYKPVWEDWLYRVALPLLVYVMLAIAALSANTHEHEALFGVAGVSLLLLFTGIHHAWDNVVYLTFVKPE